MPRSFSRITLDVTGVKVERLQEISEEDAFAEGCRPSYPFDEKAANPYRSDHNDTARRDFAALWGSLHGPDAWEANPEAVAISFRRLFAEIAAECPPP
jgi:hypothetical protein